MRAIIRASLRFRLLVVAVAAGVLALGLSQLRNAPADVLPEFTPPYVEIQTEALGLSADEIEQLVTVPLEADLLNGVQGVDVIRSDSVPGMSSIVLVFEPGTDVYRGRQLVQERLTQMGAAAWPNISAPPTVLAPLSSSSRVLMIGISSRDISPIEKSVIARWTIRPRLMGVPGVANVAIWGMRDQQLQVQVDPERLRDRDVTLDQIVSTTGNAQVFSPLSHLEGSTPGTGGFIETPQQRMQVRNVFERLADPEELAKVPVEGTGGRLALGDVADIEVDHQPLIGDAVVQDADGLLLVVEKFPGANTLEVTRGVEDALEDLRPGLAGMQTDTSIFRPASFIEDATDAITLAIVAGALLALVLAAFLLQWRTLLIAAVTVPVSLIAAALVLDALDQTFNAISFAGLAAATAVVVDEAVTGAEAVARRLRQAGEAPHPASTARVVQQATLDVRSPLMFVTLIVLLAIVPVAVMEGRPGAFLEPLALSYALAVAAAALVAMTVTPALAVLLFAKWGPRRQSPVLRRIGARYLAALAAFMRRPRTALLAAAGCAVVGLAALPLLGTSLIPSFKDRDVLVRLDGEPGTSNQRMTAIASEASRELRSVPGVDAVGAHVGRAVTGDQVVDVNSSEVWVSIDSGADYEETLGNINDVVGRVEGVDRDVASYTTQRIRDVGALTDGENAVRSNDLDVLTGTDTPLAVRVYGQDPDELRRQADRVRQVVARVDGVVDPRVDLPAQQPTLEIEVDLARAQRHGIKPGDVRRAEATLLQGLKVGSVFQEQKVFDVIVQGVPEVRQSVAAVRGLLIDRPEGGHVRLGQVADVRVRPTAAVIRRESVSRRVDVEAGVSGRGLDDVAADVRARLASMTFPLEYHAEVLERTTGREIAAGRMLWFAIAAAMAAFLLLQAAFRSWRLATVTALVLPVALAGGALAALIGGAELSLGSLVAFLALFALAARHGVLLLRHLLDLEAREGMRPAAELVERGASERLAPTLATIVALAALCLPFVVLGARPGLEVLHPMAVVLLGGLVTSAFASLFVLPALSVRLGGLGRPRRELEDAVVEQWAGFGPAAGDEGASRVAPAGNGAPEEPAAPGAGPQPGEER
jgi:CzcA family heavy metal efflux pump